MKRATSLFNQIIDYENIRLAYLKARRGKTSKNPVIKFSRNLNQNLELVRKNLIAEKPVWSKYHQFKITDPKERLISAVPFIDRVMHHAIINVLEDVFERQFIFHTYACRKGKGTHSALKAVYNHIDGDEWFIKLDVRKYFDNINHEVLKNQLKHIIKDKKVLVLLFSVIDSYGTKIGLPIGNLTSQFFANLYLSVFDHFVLEKLKPKFYCRYMDDMLIFFKSKHECKKNVLIMKKYLLEKLRLNLKPVIIGKTVYGIPFLGRKVSKNGIKFLNEKMKRKIYKIKYIIFLYESDYISEEKYIDRIGCVLAEFSLNV